MAYIHVEVDPESSSPISIWIKTNYPISDWARGAKMYFEPRGNKLAIYSSNIGVQQMFPILSEQDLVIEPIQRLTESLGGGKYGRITAMMEMPPMRQQIDIIYHDHRDEESGEIILFRS